jgi:uncharacterized protein
MNATKSLRYFLRKLRSFLLSIVSFDFRSLIYDIYGKPIWFVIEQVELILPHLPKSFSGIRVIHISDIHIGGWVNRKRLSDVVRVVIDQKPDLVVMTGDFVAGKSWSEDLDEAAQYFVEEVSKLTDDYLVLAVLGNHDHWTNAEKVRGMLSKSGVIDLNNDIHSLGRGDDLLHIAGVDDFWENKANLDDVYKLLPEDDGAILLAHEPDFVDISSREGRFDLQLSGHTHGGQVVIPFFGPLHVVELGRKYPSGLYAVGKMWQYTSRGVGKSFPIRINCPPEITVFTLKAV